MCQRRHRQRRRRVRWGLMFALAASKPDDVVHFKPRITGLALHVVRSSNGSLSLSLAGLVEDKKIVTLAWGINCFLSIRRPSQSNGGTAGLNSQRAEIIRIETKRFNKVGRILCGC
ncbi:hypothetical protein CKAH01_04590 [Colletotrichum kahawae]|uniref:Uncharacterized protein n=1 Tax=Colletotrichum kahawae TaxID=34407 RepID=A0AAD9YKH8_COLKA|nr:hypothetical protein CKAH01_04590 [Colletotrichum kahawae]